MRALTGGAGLGPRASERPYARERICVAGLTRRGAPRRMDARDARPHRAGYLADLDLASCRTRARAGFVCCGGVPVGPGLARGPAARGKPVRRPAPSWSLPMRSTPHVPSGGHPARGGQDSTESGAISAKQENSLRATTFRDQVLGGVPKRQPQPAAAWTGTPPTSPVPPGKPHWGAELAHRPIPAAEADGCAAVTDRDLMVCAIRRSARCDRAGRTAADPGSGWEFYVRGCAQVLRPSWRILSMLSSTPNAPDSFPPLTRKM